MELFWKIAPRLGFSREQFMVIDHRESFYFFAMNQKADLRVHDVFLMECNANVLYYDSLTRDIRTVPQVVTIEESGRLQLGEDRDADFLKVLQKAFDGRVVSSVYLVGDGFEGEWMKDSLVFLCRGRRAFVGNNLYSKGACYAAYIRDHEDEWQYIYMGENEMKFNISLKVKNQGNLEFFNLISAGKNWFETHGECEVILGGSSEVELWKQLPNSRKASIETLELTDIPARPDRTTRLRITASPVADDKVEIVIRDLGFGELFRSTDKTWRYTMSI
jgi:hypothetical protein